MTPRISTRRLALSLGATLALGPGLAPASAQDSPCGSKGSCYVEHGGPGCDDATCCGTVCTQDPYCCEGSWDGLCAARAQLVCAPPSSDLNLDGFVGAADLAILLGNWGTSASDLTGDGLVDASDISVLFSQWSFGSPTPPPCPGTEPCTEAHATPGCSDATCCELVCATDPACCATGWDDVCVLLAEKLCVACCQHDLKLFNTLPNVHTLAIIPTNQAAIRDVYNVNDIEDWELAYSGGEYLLTPGSDVPSGLFPTDASAELDAEVVIAVDRSLAPTIVFIEWRDINGAPLKVAQVTLECPDPDVVGTEKFVETYDWEANSVHLAGAPDSLCFAGCSPIECESFDDSFEDEDSEEIGAKKMAASDIDHVFSCDGNNTNILTLTAPGDPAGATQWKWVVSVGGSQTTYTKPTGPSDPSPTSIEVPLPAGAYDIIADVSLGIPSQQQPGTLNWTAAPQLKIDDVCLVHPDFSTSTPKPDCNGTTLAGWKVSFWPSLQTIACFAASYEWKFGDGTTKSGGPGYVLPVIDHPYPIPAGGSGTYTATLTVKDAFGGCTRTSVDHTVTIKGTCDPAFEALYSWCAGEDITTVEVQFTNTTQSFCDTTYTWNFGDGSPLVQDNGGTVSHTYTGLVESGQTFNVTLKMTDSGRCAGPTGKSVTIPVTLKPVSAALTVTVCPNGQAYASATTSPDATLSWSLPSSCWAKQIEVNLDGKHHQFDCSPGCGTQDNTISVDVDEKRSAQVTARCQRSQVFDVECTCVPDVKVRGRSQFADGSSQYQIKWKDKVHLVKHACRTTVKGRTLFQKKRGFFWLRQRALDDGSTTGYVKVDSNHVFRIRGGSGVCGCDTDSTDGNGAKTKNNRMAVKFKNKNKGLPPRSITKQTLFESLHEVVHHGHTWSVLVQKAAGLSVETFNFTPTPDKLKTKTPKNDDCTN